MEIYYYQEFDRLYLRFDPKPQPVTNVRLSDSIVLDVGADDKIVGIEILDASRTIHLGSILPIQVRAETAAPVQ